MNKEKIDLSKPKKEYKKFQKESESLVDELKINKEEQEEEILEEEIEAKFWGNLYKEKLEEVTDDEDFKKSAISDLENRIKLGKNGDGADANWAFWVISSYKNIGIFNKEVTENLKEILDDEKFKRSAISDLEDDIKSGKNGNGNRANWALRNISAYKNLGIFDSQPDESLKKVLNDKEFKKAAFGYLENRIRSGKDGSGGDANQALWAISVYKDVSEYFKDLADQKIAKKARKEDKGDNIPKRPEIK